MAGPLQEVLARQPVERIVLSRASWLTTADTAGVASISCPVVGGQTVWEAVAPLPGDLWVLEVPNYFGRFERRRPVAQHTVAIRRFGSVPPSVPVIEAEASVPDGAVRAAHRLSGGLRQLPGVALAHGMAVTPWFVILLPGNAAAAARVLASHGYPECFSLEAGYPELPGGLRITVAWPHTEIDRFISALRGWLEAREG